MNALETFRFESKNQFNLVSHAVAFVLTDQFLWSFFSATI
jgi:hypothetical protein